MDWYPLWNSIRIAALSSVIVFFVGIFTAYYVARLPGWVKGILDVIYPSHGAASYSVWLFPVTDIWSASPCRRMAGKTGNTGGDDLVWRDSCIGSGGIPSYVSDSPGGF